MRAWAVWRVSGDFVEFCMSDYLIFVGNTVRLGARREVRESECTRISEYVLSLKAGEQYLLTANQPESLRLGKIVDSWEYIMPRSLTFRRAELKG